MIDFTYKDIYGDYCAALSEGDYKYAEYIKQEAIDEVMKELDEIKDSDKGPFKVKQHLMMLYNNLLNMNPDGGF